jgi:hypothetical protein
MATGNLISIGASTPVLITPAVIHSGVDITIQNISTTAIIYIGSSAVSSANYGHAIQPESAVAFAVQSRDEIYAVSSESGSQVAVLTMGLN